jgi:hypothetical protein
MPGRLFACALGAYLAIVSTASAQTPNWSGPVRDIDGALGEQYDGPGTSDVRLRYRPTSAADTTLLVENVYIHDVWNQKGIDIGATVFPDRSSLVYDNVTVRHYEGARINRDEARFPGYHMDFLRVSGAGDAQATPTDVTLDDIYIHDGDALPIIIQDGWFGTVTLRNVRIERTSLSGVQIATIKSGRIDHLIIEGSPGLNVALMFQPGTIGTVDVIDSDGAKVSYTEYAALPNALPNAVAALPEPAAMGVALVGLLGLARRNRRGR